MNIKVYGFTWNIEPPENHIEKFLNYIQSLNQTEIDSLDAGIPDGVNYKRITLITNLENGLWGGILLTIKNTRKFIRATKSEKGFTLSTSEIEKDQNFADANFFVFNPQTGAGLYEYYHLSAYLNTFNADTKYKFGLFRSIENIRAKFVYSQYLTPSDFQEHIQSLISVHNVEYELSTIAIPASGIIPASGFVSRIRQKVFYDRTEHSSPELKNGLLSFIINNLDDLKRMFVKGSTIDGNDVIYSLMDDNSTLHEREFKNFTIDLDLRADVDTALKSSDNLRHLTTVSKRLEVRDFFYTNREP